MDSFFVERDFVDLVVTARLEEHVTDLTRPHRDDPSEDGRGEWVDRDERVGREEATPTEQVQRLIHVATVVVAMIVPALLSELLEEGKGLVVSRDVQRFPS